MGWVSGVGIPCTGTTSGESRQTQQKLTENTGFSICRSVFAGRFVLGGVWICCKAQNDALRSVSLTLTSKRRAEEPPAGMFMDVTEVNFLGACVR